MVGESRAEGEPCRSQQMPSFSSRSSGFLFLSALEQLSFRFRLPNGSELHVDLSRGDATLNLVGYTADSFGNSSFEIHVELWDDAEVDDPSEVLSSKRIVKMPLKIISSRKKTEERKKKKKKKKQPKLDFAKFNPSSLGIWLGHMPRRPLNANHVAYQPLLLRTTENDNFERLGGEEERVEAESTKVCPINNGAHCTCRGQVSVAVYGLRDHSRVCDGFYDCPDGDDETGCSVTVIEQLPRYGEKDCSSGSRNVCLKCPEGHWYCSHMKMRDPDLGCYSREMRCDGVVDCARSAKDEASCVRLLKREDVEQGISKEGILQRMVKGEWHVVCSGSASLVRASAVEACTKLSGIRRSRSEMPKMERFTTGRDHQSPPVGRNFASFDSNQGKWHVVPSCETSMFHVICPSPRWRSDVCDSDSPPFREMRVVFNLLGDDVRGKSLEEVESALRAIPEHTDSADDGDDDDDDDDERIVGGTATRTESRSPWLVAIIRNQQRHHCGGALLHPKWIVTAAHCFFERVPGTRKRYTRIPVEVFEVRAGMIRRASASPNTQVRRLRKAFPHPDYSVTLDPTNRFVTNDIAMVEVDTPFLFTPSVSCISVMEPTSKLREGMPCIAAGWGASHHFAFDNPDHLQEVVLPVAEPCPLDYAIGSQSMMCTLFRPGGKGPCYGDSGGPLICRLNGKISLCGVVSHGARCGGRVEPTVYTKVSHYLPWMSSFLATTVES